MLTRCKDGKITICSSQMIIFNFMRIPKVMEFEFQLFFFPCFSHIRYFYTLFHRVNRFRFSGVKR